MCGILGWHGENISKDLFGKALDSMYHRGPDGRGVECFEREGGTILLGHRRLSIIDLSDLAGQPMHNEDKSVWLVCNGEIYNYVQLRDDLKKNGHIFRSESDSEVLVHLWEEKGEEMLESLNGIFAFGIWDEKQKKLFLARDQFGVKPFYYAETEEGFLFSSEIKAMLHFPSVKKEINPVGVHNYMTYLWSPPPDTMLKSVKKLPPAHAMTVKDGKVESFRQYYKTCHGRGVHKKKQSSIISDIQDLFLSAVNRQLISDVPLGAFLSGGIDSSSITAMMKKIQPDKRPRCYSIGFRDCKTVEGNPDDLPYAKKVADDLDLDLCEIRIEPDDIMGHIKDMVYFLEEPQGDPAVINAYLICRKAKEDGYKVLLSGTGGDDIFSGYRRHLAVGIEKTWSGLPVALRKSMAYWAGKKAGKTNIIRRMKKAFLYADLSPEDRLISYFFWMDERTRRGLYSRDFLEKLEEYHPARPLMNSLGEIPGDTHPLEKMLYLDLKHFLTDHNLNYADKMGMASSVEVRVPFLDRDLVDYVSRIPPSLKQRFFKGKWIFKKAMQPYLPEEIIRRAKSGFGVPLRAWIHGGLKGMVDKYLSDERIRRRNIFDPAQIKKLISMDKNGTIDAAYVIFTLVSIEMWCETFLDIE